MKLFSDDIFQKKYNPSHKNHTKLSSMEKKIKAKQLKTKTKPTSNGFIKKDKPMTNGVNHMTNGGLHFSKTRNGIDSREAEDRRGLLRIPRSHKVSTTCDITKLYNTH